MHENAKLGAVLSAKGGSIIAVAPRSTVYDAIALMADKGIGAVLVMEEGRLLGILSERDYTRKVILMGRHSPETFVDEIMTQRVITTTAEETVEGAMRIMTENRIRHLPVMDGSRVIGVVSVGDLVKWVISAHEETIAHLRHYIAGGYMT